MNCKKEDLASWKKEGVKLEYLDIREFYEDPELNVEEVKHVPMGDLLSYSFNDSSRYILICGSGQRAAAAAMELKRKYDKIDVYALLGGADAYLAL